MTANGIIRDAVCPEDGVVVVSKVGADPHPRRTVPLRPSQRPEELTASVENNLKTLGLDQIPVVNLRRLECLRSSSQATGCRRSATLILSINSCHQLLSSTLVNQR